MVDEEVAVVVLAVTEAWSCLAVVIEAWIGMVVVVVVVVVAVVVVVVVEVVVVVVVVDVVVDVLVVVVVVVVLATVVVDAAISSFKDLLSLFSDTLLKIQGK